MKRNLAIVLLFISSIVWAQDTAWKKHTVYDLSILFPGEPTRIDTAFTKDGFTADAVILTVQQEDCSLTLTVIGGMDKSNDSEKKLLKDVGEGFCKGAQTSAYRCLISDTVIDNLPAKKGLLFMSQLTVPVSSYMVIMNDRLYNLTAAFADDNEQSLLMIKRFLTGADFNNAAKRTKVSKGSGSAAYRIGKLVGTALAAGLILFLVIWAIKKNKSKEQTNIS